MIKEMKGLKNVSDSKQNKWNTEELPVFWQ